MRILGLDSSLSSPRARFIICHLLPSPQILLPWREEVRRRGKGQVFDKTSEVIYI
jgi:hypothetical protein